MKKKLIRFFIVMVLCGVATIPFIPDSSAHLSGNTNGCYADWQTTVTCGRCNAPKVKVTGYYALWASRTVQTAVQTPWSHIKKGSIINPFATINAVFGIRDSYVIYRG